MNKFSCPSFDLQTIDGRPVYGDLRGNYSLGGNTYDKHGAPHGTINVTLRDDRSGNRRAKMLAEAQAQLQVALHWVDGPQIFGIEI